MNYCRLGASANVLGTSRKWFGRCLKKRDCNFLREKQLRVADIAARPEKIYGDSRLTAYASPLLSSLCRS